MSELNEIQRLEAVARAAKEVEKAWINCCPTATTLEERDLSAALKLLNNTAEEE